MARLRLPIKPGRDLGAGQYQDGQMIYADDLNAFINIIGTDEIQQNTITKELDELSRAASNLQQNLQQTTSVLQNKIDGGFLSDGFLYLTSEGEIIVGPLGPFAGGGGGGGGGSSYTVTLKNTLPSRSITTTRDTQIILTFDYSSIDGAGEDDGPGVGKVVVGGIIGVSFTAQQGHNSIDITDLITEETNNVRLTVENSEGVVRMLTYTVTIVTLSISTTQDLISQYTTDATIFYTVTGEGDKTVHFIVDGIEIGTEIVSTSGRSRSYVIPQQSHGSHIVEIYASITLAGITTESQRLKLCMMWINSLSSQPIIATSFSESTIMEGNSIVIPYAVYDPYSEYADVILQIEDVNGSIYKEIEISKNRALNEKWTITDYPSVSDRPSWNIRLSISCRNITLFLPITIMKTDFPLKPITDSLVLEFTAAGRNNNEINPANWSYGENITASFEGFGFLGADGWVTDENDIPVLRFLPGDMMTIPFKPFALDFRQTGYTIEVDLATRDVQDYDSVVMTCLNGGIGFKITSQSAELHSEQQQVAMLFKEDSHIRITFVVEAINEHAQYHLIYIYINGIMCGVSQYPQNDNFAQRIAQNIVIGAETCGLDLYSIRCYKKSLNRNEQLDNFICDQPTSNTRLSAYTENNILNSQQEVSIEKLPSTLPYMIISCIELPQYKGDKKSGCEITFTDPSATNKSFTASGVEIDVQGTSSAGYPVKNYKLKYKSGFETEEGHVNAYAIKDGSMPVSVQCLKADYASCEGANNVELVQLYDEVCKALGYTTPPQRDDPRIRQGISGRPIAVFWHDSGHNEISFVGKYNMNWDKAAREGFGFTDEYPNAESWEFKNNTSNICLFKDDNLTNGNWEDHLEAREPDGHTDTSALQRVFTFVVSHNRDTVNTIEEKEAMLADFKAHFADYFVLNNMLFYYLFTETFLMIDSRAKNMFLTTYDGIHWLPLPYDFDTAIGINNEGTLSFEYNLEDTDTINGAQVFNGQSSVLWQNVRDAFSSELKQMYNTIRSGNYFNYNHIQQLFENHQAVWPERLWNEDMYKKYLIPLLNEGSDNLAMVQGDKGSQREWWLYNAFKYRDSKYATGDALSNSIYFRGYTDENHPISDANITLTPYSHIWAAISFASGTSGNSYMPTKRMERNETYTFINPMSTMNDTEIYIRSADRLSDVGDLSAMNMGSANFSAANKLRRLIIGKNDPNYSNTKLESLTVGNNELLTLLNICNCVALATNIDLSGCTSIETILATGSAITGVQLPIGGHLATLALPATITNLTIQNQKNLENFSMEGYDSLQTLHIENTANIPLINIIDNADNLQRVRLVGIEWEADSTSALMETIEKLSQCTGIDATGANIDSAVVVGKVHVSSITDEILESINDIFPQLTVVIGGVAQYYVRYVDYNGNLLYRAIVSEGANAIDPVSAGFISTPIRPDDDDGSYLFNGWGSLPTNIHANQVVTARYTGSYRVRYMNPDGTILWSTSVADGGTVTYGGSSPTMASTAQYTYTFQTWSGADDNRNGQIYRVTEPRVVTAVYTNTIRTYTVTWKNSDNTVLKTDTNVPYGSSVIYDGITPVHPEVPEHFTFREFIPNGQEITGNTICIAQYTDIRTPLLKYLASVLDVWDNNTVQSIGQYAFYEQDELTDVRTAATSIGQNAFTNAGKLANVDLTASGAISIGTQAFYGCNALESLIIRSNNVATLSGVSGFPETAFGVGSAALYVPNDLVDSYKVANYWTIISERIFPISAYPVTNFSTISDSWSEIIQSVNNNTYASKYHIGDLKKIDISGYDGNCYMQIVAIDTDVLADESGNAKITWITWEPYFNGRISETNWEDSSLRTYLNNDIKANLPEEVANAIVSVQKSYRNGANSTAWCTDKLWVPSYREIFGTGNYAEDDGVTYSSYFNTNARRRRHSSYRLRSKTSSSNYVRVNNNGASISTETGGWSSDAYYMFGFCM